MSISINISNLSIDLNNLYKKKYKCIVGVIASYGEDYNNMKKSWIENVNSFNKLSKLYEVEVYFLYGINDNCNDGYNINKIDNNIYDFYANCKECFENIFTKSIQWFDYICNIKKVNQVQEDKLTFVIRGNLSTVYKFDTLFDDLIETSTQISLKKDLEDVLFLGGSFIDHYKCRQVVMSGTNLIYSILSLKLIIENVEHIITLSKADDICLSLWLSNYKNVIMKDFRRLDFVEKIVFRSCDYYYNKIPFFRFKTEHRKTDCDMIKYLISDMYRSDFTTNKFINTMINKHKIGNTVYKRNVEYSELYTKKCFIEEKENNEWVTKFL